MKVAISDNAQGRQSKTVHALANALTESTKPQPFSYIAVTKIPVKLPEQQYTGHNPPAMSDYVPFRPFGFFF